MPLVLVTANLLLLFCTALPMWRHPHWIVRSMEFPRLFLFYAFLVVQLAQLLVLDLSAAQSWAMICLNLAGMSWQLRWILPYTPIWHPEVVQADRVDEQQQISVLVANVLMSNRDAQSLIELVRENNPDLLVTLESDHWWQDQLDAALTEYLYTVKCPHDNYYGMHVYAKLPLHDMETTCLVEDDVPSIHGLVELRSGARVRVHFLHPAPPSPTENEEAAERDAELVLVSRSVSESRLPVIVTGDLNDVAWSYTTRLFRRISGLLDPRVGRGMFNTFHAHYRLLRWPLDHLFHSPDFNLIKIARLRDIGSDHFPLLTMLEYKPAREGISGEVSQADLDTSDELLEQVDEVKDRVPV